MNCTIIIHFCIFHGIVFSLFNPPGTHPPFIHTIFHDPQPARPVDITVGTAGYESTRASLANDSLTHKHQFKVISKACDCLVDLEHTSEQLDSGVLSMFIQEAAFSHWP